MSDTFWQGLAMAVYLIAMLVIGWYSYRRTHNLGDYMLGGRDLSPSVAPGRSTRPGSSRRGSRSA